MRDVAHEQTGQAAQGRPGVGPGGRAGAGVEEGESGRDQLRRREENAAPAGEDNPPDHAIGVLPAGGPAEQHAPEDEGDSGPGRLRGSGVEDERDRAGEEDSGRHLRSRELPLEGQK